MASAIAVTRAAFRDVPIEGRRLDAEPLGELAQRHAVEAVGVEQCDGLGDDPLPVQCHKLALPDPSISAGVAL
jgi:hypothetical protein